jgi:glycosyltransferase involved in cell wall biosynthesis
VPPRIDRRGTLTGARARGADTAYPAPAMLSAVVPTHNRPAELRQCLETLQVQDVERADLEVIVVDDGSPADIGAVVAEVAARGAVEMRCERLELSGLNGARNHGAAQARGQVLAFLDDDTLVAPGWARALLGAFEAHRPAAVGGRIKLQLAGPEPEWLTARRYYLAEYDFGPEPFWIEDELIDGRDSLPVGANCSVTRADFERLGGFRPGLDRISGSLVSNGDTEFFRRLRAAGGRMRYEPAAEVIHCVPAGRLTVEYFVERSRAQGISDELLYGLEHGPGSWGRRLLFARQLGAAAVRLCGDAVRGRPTVGDRFDVAYCAGRLAAVGKAPPAVGR